MSPEILTIQDCMSRVMGDVREVAKNDLNTQQHFTFRGVDAVVNAVAPALRRHNVLVLPNVESKEYMAFESSKGTAMMCCRVTVRFRFVGPGGDFLEATVAGESMDAGDKSTAKAMSVAFRTVLLQALALPTDDLDPDAETYDVAPSAAPGESTAEPNTGQGSVTSPRDGEGAQAADVPLTTSGSLQGAPAASPTLSVVGTTTDDAASEEATGREATVTPSSGAAPVYLNADEKRELIRDYGSQKKVLAAFQARFGEHIQRMADITCDDVEAMNE
jgi:hypothetical protein